MQPDELADTHNAHKCQLDAHESNPPRSSTRADGEEGGKGRYLLSLYLPYIPHPCILVFLYLFHTYIYLGFPLCSFCAVPNFVSPHRTDIVYRIYRGTLIF